MRVQKQQMRNPELLEDVYLESKLTGELLPSSEAIRKFYETHDAMDDWQSEWRETDIVTGSAVPLPKFGDAVQVKKM